jgi:hypothetical protein
VRFHGSLHDLQRATGHQRLEAAVAALMRLRGG